MEVEKKVLICPTNLFRNSAIGYTKYERELNKANQPTNCDPGLQKPHEWPEEAKAIPLIEECPVSTESNQAESQEKHEHFNS